MPIIIAKNKAYLMKTFIIDASFNGKMALLK
jgi:hypothetical protein